MSDFRHRAEPVVKRSRSIQKGQLRARLAKLRIFQLLEEPVVPRHFPGSFASGVTKSMWLTPSACANSYNVMMVGFRRPRSKSLRYCWLKSL